VPHPEWGEEVQAFIVRGDPTLDAASLERHVRLSDLSSYQRPRVYTFVPELPRTSTNKVLRRVLRETALRSADAVAGLEIKPSQSTGRT
jgi:acyl-CoA synthetase (AMP-forming)/AMP-acid ligase II